MAWPAAAEEEIIAGLRCVVGGPPGPPLLLIHGLGATAEVWAGVAGIAEQRWPGYWLAPDLPGHGGSARSATGDYNFAMMAASLTRVLRAIAPEEPVTALGHSLGGVLALDLAGGRHGARVERAVGVGIKVGWTEAELERAAALARRPATVFGTRAEVVDRYLRVSGLAGLFGPDDPRIAPGITRTAAEPETAELGTAVEPGTAEGWRLTLDQRTFGVGAPPMTELLAHAGCPVTLAAGEHDRMVTIDQLQALQPYPVRLTGLGHNAHVEDPEAVWALLADRAEPARR